MIHCAIKEVINTLSEQTDTRELFNKISKHLIKITNCEGVEISYLFSKDEIKRIYFAFVNNNDIIDEPSIIDDKFGSDVIDFENSLLGHSLSTNTSILWHSEHKNFKEFINDNSIPKNKNTANYYLNAFQSKKIFNFLLIPLMSPLSLRDENSYQHCFCIHFFNIGGETTPEKKLLEYKENIEESLNVLKSSIFNMVFHKKLSIQKKFNESIREVELQCGDFECALEKILQNFSTLLESSINTIWFYNSDYKLIGLHHLLIRNEFSKTELNKKDFIKKIFDSGLNVLKVESSVLGILIDENKKYLVAPDISKLNIDKKYNWEFLNEIGKNKFIGFCIRKKGVIIALMGFHPSENKYNEFKDYYENYIDYLDHSADLLMNFSAKQYIEKSKLMILKIKNLSHKKYNVLFKEFAYKITEVIGSELCSIYRVRNDDTNNSGVYLMASSCRLSEYESDIDKKIYDIDNSSITGFVAKERKGINVFDIHNVSKFYPDIRGFKEPNFENKSCVKQKNYIAVTTSTDDQSKEYYLIYCVNKKGPQRQKNYLFSDEDIHLLNHFALILGRYIDLTEVLKERNDLIDVIIHEIESPIVSMRSTIDVILNSSFDKRKLDQKITNIDLMGHILKRWLSSTSMLNDLLQEKDIKPNKEWHNLHWLIENVIFWMTPELDRSKLKPHDINIKDIDKHKKLYVDSDHFTQIISNIIGNALKYHLKGENVKIKIFTKQNDNSFYLNISDRGVGISETPPEIVFEKGYRNPEIRKSDLKGKGFGLWLCKRLLSFNNINIKIISVSKPTIFCIEIPENLIK
jgi:signal transduction histidine kinase